MVLTVILFAAILFGNWFFFQRLPSAFLPSEDKGTVFCDVTLPPGATLPRTRAVLDDLEELIKDHPAIAHILAVPGRSFTAGEGENLGMMILSLKPWSERSAGDAQIANVQREIIRRCRSIADASVNVFVPPAIMGLGTTGGVSFALQATGNQTSQEIAQTANGIVARLMESGKAVYAFTTFDASTPMLYLDINRDKAEAMNLPVNSIFTALQSQLGSYYINDFNKYGKTYKVKMQLAPELRENRNIIDQLHVTASDGGEVPLSAIFALLFFGMALNIYCQLGLLMLIGLTAKTAILMVEFSKQEREDGASVADAALNGMRVRFRSVMMTALSFVIGVFPMVTASGAGAGSRQAIGVTTFWGMLLATILGMMFIPGLYSIFQRMAEFVCRKKK